VSASYESGDELCVNFPTLWSTINFSTTNLLHGVGTWDCGRDTSGSECAFVNTVMNLASWMTASFSKNSAPWRCHLMSMPVVVCSSSFPPVSTAVVRHTHFQEVSGSYLSRRVTVISFSCVSSASPGSKKVSVKLSLCFNWAPRHEGILGEWRYSSTHSLTSALDEGEGSTSRPGRFTPKERAPGTHWIGGWVGPRAVLDAVVKRKIPSPRRESDPRTPIVQPVAQRYTDSAITALSPGCFRDDNGTLPSLPI
jgi:hypothetical protein